MGQFEDVLSFEVDFNNFDKGGKLLKGSLWHASGHRMPRAGERALLHDGEGNRCWATIRDVRSGVMVLFELDDSTWVSGEQATTQTVSAGTVGNWAVQK
jgi:hypothetical protein